MHTMAREWEGETEVELVVVMVVIRFRCLMGSAVSSPFLEKSMTRVFSLALWLRFEDENGVQENPGECEAAREIRKNLWPK